MEFRVRNRVTEKGGFIVRIAGRDVQGDLGPCHLFCVNWEKDRLICGHPSRALRGFCKMKSLRARGLFSLLSLHRRELGRKVSGRAVAPVMLAEAAFRDALSPRTGGVAVASERSNPWEGDRLQGSSCPCGVSSGCDAESNKSNP